MTSDVGKKLSYLFTPLGSTKTFYHLSGILNINTGHQTNLIHTDRIFDLPLLRKRK